MQDVLKSGHTIVVVSNKPLHEYSLGTLIWPVVVIFPCKQKMYAVSPAVFWCTVHPLYIGDHCLLQRIPIPFYFVL